MSVNRINELYKIKLFKSGYLSEDFTVDWLNNRSRQRKRARASFFGSKS